MTTDANGNAGFEDPAQEFHHLMTNEEFNIHAGELYRWIAECCNPDLDIIALATAWTHIRVLEVFPQESLERHFALVSELARDFIRQYSSSEIPPPPIVETQQLKSRFATFLCGNNRYDKAQQIGFKGCEKAMTYDKPCEYALVAHATGIANNYIYPGAVMCGTFDAYLDTHLSFFMAVGKGLTK